MIEFSIPALAADFAAPILKLWLFYFLASTSASFRPSFKVSTNQARVRWRPSSSIPFVVPCNSSHSCDWADVHVGMAKEN